MNEPLKFLPYSYVIELHRQLIERHGGKGDLLLNPGMLESALGRAQQPYYVDIVEHAAALMESIAKNHPFLDGNKRAAFFTMRSFLELNDYTITCTDQESYRAIMQMFESNSYDFDNLERWLRTVIEPKIRKS